MNMSDGGPFCFSEYASLSSVLPLITPTSTPPPNPHVLSSSLSLCCLSNHRTVKFILIPPFRRLTVHTTFYQSWTVELINWYWRSINRGDKLFGSRRLRSHDFSYLRFYNYSPGGESRCGAPSQKWNKTCAHIHGHAYSYKQPNVHVLHRIVAVIITLIIWPEIALDYHH